MKIIHSVFTFLLALSMQAQAHQGEANTSKEVLEKYQEAAVAALTGRTTCFKFGQIWNLDVVIPRAQKVQVLEGPNPVLIFERVFSEESRKQTGRDMLKVFISTDASYTTVSEVQVEEYNVGLINDGTLKDPKLRHGYVLQEKAVCGRNFLPYF